MTNEPSAEAAENERIANITLDERTVVRRSPEIEHERQVAIYDLLEENHFAPRGVAAGPYDLALSIEEGRLVFTVTNATATPLTTIALSLTPFRRIIRDYFGVCESYFEAIKTASPAKIEAIDMGRRGLHNEGSEILCARLKDKISLDFDTARRLFTLICVLHIRS